MVLTLERAGFICRQPGVRIEVLVPPDDLPVLQANITRQNLCAEVLGPWRTFASAPQMSTCGVKRTFGGVSFRHEMPWSSCHKWEPYLVSSFKESGDAASWN